jgi:hypothetical protein
MKHLLHLFYPNPDKEFHKMGECPTVSIGRAPQVNRYSNRKPGGGPVDVESLLPYTPNKLNLIITKG